MNRSLWSTAIVSFLGSAVSGFLWIGRPRHAIGAVFVGIATIGLMLWQSITGEFDFSAPFVVWVLPILSVAIVLPFRRDNEPIRPIPPWYISSLVVLAGPIIFGSMALAFRAFFFQPMSIGSSAMVPGLLPGDIVWVSKSAFGFRTPFGTFGRRDPSRGDVIAYEGHDLDSYVFRVVGLPNETVEMVKGAPQVNGIAFAQNIAEELTNPETGKPVELQIEANPEGLEYPIVNFEYGTLMDDTGPFEVPKGQYFVLGDNRDNSNDSRFDAGTVPADAIIGKVVRVFANTAGLRFEDRREVN